MLFAVAGGLALLAALDRGAAQEPAVDPNQDLYITPAAGPWVICAAAYTGPDAARLAREFALELRNTHKLPAYLFNRGVRERQEQRQELNKLHERYPEAIGKLRTVRIPDQYAVLVGGYKDAETASKALAELKKTEAPKSWTRFMSVLTFREQETKDGPVREQKMYDNPLSHSMVTRNPTVPAEKPADKPDPFLKTLNAGESYNLLKCGKPWTLAVKEFMGPAVLQESQVKATFLDKIGLGNRSADMLTATALQAHEVAKVLREMKFDAYVLHTRGSSVVSVGAFDRPDDPVLLQLQQKLGGLEFRGTGIKLFVRPLPMQVPQL